MNDVGFVKATVERGLAAAQKVREAFDGATVEQLNWKPAPERWSVAQCLDHLIVADAAYFPILQRIVDGDYKAPWRVRWSPLNGLWGWALLAQTKEEGKNKMKALPKFAPTSSDFDGAIVDRFHAHLNTLLDYFARCEDVDLDRTIIVSPALSFVTYSLRVTFTLLVQHAHRHINQAIRVTQIDGYPAS